MTREQIARVIATHPDGGNITPGSSLLTERVIAGWLPLADAILALHQQHPAPPSDTADQRGGDVEGLIRWLQNASVTHFDFTIDGRQEVCKPKYLLTRHRDMIIAALTAHERPTALVEFARWVIREGCWDTSLLDGGEIQEKAQELGLIEETTYDPDKHGPSDLVEPGDPWFVFASIIAEDREKGPST